MLCLLTLGGCVVYPPYPFAKAEKTASLKLMNMGKPSMCKGGSFYSVAADANGYVPVPAGERISLGTFMYFDGYMVSYSCSPYISFIPKEGEKYVMHDYIQGSKCFVEVVREDGGKATSVSFEPSLGPRDCFAKKAGS